MTHRGRYRALGALCLLCALAVLMTGCTAQFGEAEIPKKEARAKEPLAGGRGETTPLILEAEEAENPSQPEGETPEADVAQLESALTMSNGFTDIRDQVTVNEDAVNLRAEAQTGSPIIAQLKAGEVLERTGYSGEWSRVLYQGQTCYVFSRFVTPQEPAQEEAETQEQGLVQAAADGEAAVPINGRKIVIDPGHQAKENSGKEPAGPSSETMARKMTAGAEGSVLGLRECDLTLSVAKKLERILTERGYEIVMIRESNDVNLSYAERAQKANESGAQAFVRLHAHAQESSGVTGVLGSCQSPGNPYNGELAASSNALTRQITDHMSQATGAKNRGVQETDISSEINWTSIPTAVVEMGFLSSPQEEALLAQDEYQERLAAGIADGIDSYFAGAASGR